MKNGDMLQAQNVLKRVYGETNSAVGDILRAIDNEIAEENALSKILSSPGERMKLSWVNKLKNGSIDLFHIGGNRRALTIACMLQGLQQLCGFV